MKSNRFTPQAAALAVLIWMAAAPASAAISRPSARPLPIQPRHAAVVQIGRLGNPGDPGDSWQARAWAIFWGLRERLNPQRLGRRTSGAMEHDPSSSTDPGI